MDALVDIALAGRASLAIDVAREFVDCRELGLVVDGRLLHVREAWWADHRCIDFYLVGREGDGGDLDVCRRVDLRGLVPFVGPLPW